MTTKANGLVKRYSGRVLKQWPCGRHGYMAVFLCNAPAPTKRYRVHHLVLEAFVGPRPPGYHGCHNNGERLDNRPENLRWDTVTENNRDIVRHGRSRLKQRACSLGHLLQEPNLTLYGLKRGRRVCRACVRANARAANARKCGLPVYRDQWADAAYDRIMGVPNPRPFAA